MHKNGSLTAVFVGLLLVGALGAPGAVRGDQTKAQRADAPAEGKVVRGKSLRDRLITREKAPAAAKSSAARIARAEKAASAVRAAEFKARVNGDAEIRELAPNKRAGRTLASAPALAAEKAAAARGGSVRAGTGGGDVFEREPNDTTADTLEDVPINVVGEIEVQDDIDFFAVPVTAGDPVRVEIIADRIFGSALDSFVTVLRDDGETEITSNDDAFDDSGDSFVRFIAPYSGYVFVGVTDTFGFGGEDFDYILNITVAETPDLEELEPNDQFSQADDLDVPGLMFAFADFEDDLDTYAISGVEGETLVVDIDAEVFESDMDVIVELDDDRGGFLFINDDTDGLDPRFNIVLPYTGTYFLTVADRQGRTGNFFYYTLNVSAQSGAEAPRVNGVKITNAGFLKRVLGSGFDPTGARAELNSEGLRGNPGRRKPTQVVVVKPKVEVFTNDIVTVVNPDGRRSNPGVIP
jgi:hypothetical protein